MGPKARLCSVSLDQEERHCTYYKDTCYDSAYDQTEVAASARGLVLPDSLDGDVAADGDLVACILLIVSDLPAFEFLAVGRGECGLGEGVFSGDSGDIRHGTRSAVGVEFDGVCGRGNILPDRFDRGVGSHGDGVTDVLLDIGYGPAFELFS